MYDVAWTDPTSETVGQRRERKDREGGKGSDARRGSIKTTSSSNSSQSAPRAKGQPKESSGWGFFRSNRNSSRDVKETLDSKPKTPSSESTTSLATSAIDRYFPEDIAINRQPVKEEDYIESVERPPTPVESVFSVPASQSAKTESSWGSSASEISSGKKYYRQKEQVSQPQYHERDNYRTAEVPAFYEGLDTVGHLMRDTTISGRNDEYTYTTNQREPIPRAPSRASNGRSPSRVGRRPSGARSQTPLPLANPPINRALPEPPPRPANSAIRLRIRRMEVANVKIILQRLVEEWSDDEDQAIYDELEFEKQLWMLIGLRYLRKKTDVKHDAKSIGPLGPCKVLSLYENHACANLLSTMYPIGSQTSHLTTTTPSNIEQTSHLHTLIVKNPTTRLPYHTSTFTTITSNRLPTLLPSSSIPTILQECHRILTPKGTLQLTIIDPTPNPTTLGPKLRTWLEDHLLLKLDTQFRCLKPGKLMPIWLEDAGFRISPSSEESSSVRITEASLKATGFSFRAVGRTEGGYKGVGKGEDGKEKEREMADTLASTVGRMLWKEVYGSFVIGRSWWWEDDEIVEEAYTLGTKWDVIVTEAVKR